jgi:peptidoglycan/LPS O-acetylase OafA/YrhL
MVNLNSYFLGKSNVLNFSRLILALFVLISHVGWFYGQDNTKIRSLGVYSVAAFFGVSGFLISQSALNAENLAQFTIRRIKRIYPAFIAILFVTAFVYYPVYIIIQFDSIDNIKLVEQVKYVVENCTLHITKDSLINSLSNSGTKDWNPSLWTLQFEFVFYLATYLSAKTITKMRKTIFPLFTILMVLLTNATPVQSASYHLFYLAQFYLFGMTLWEYRFKIEISASRIVALFSCALLSYSFLNSFALTAFIVILLILCVSIQIRTKTFAKNDFSYGMYLHAGPITHIAVLIAKKLEYPLATTYLIAIPSTFILAALSWFCIESKYIRK